MDERVLLKKLKNKSEKALEETIQKYTAYVTTIIKEIVNTRATAEDIEELVADTFIALWSTSERIDDVQYSNLKAYIGMIARNKAKDYLRMNKNIGLELYENAILIDDSPEKQILQKEQKWYIKELLTRLKPADQKIFLLHYYHYQKIEEIAVIMHMNPQTVKTRLRRGRETLRMLCDEEN
nr:sigma-70 family RNA polymerase sigma factor [uncultured Sellimonas sp.]